MGAKSTRDYEKIAKWRKERMTWKEIADKLGGNPITLRTAFSEWKARPKNQQTEPDEAPPDIFPDMEWPEDVNWREWLDTWEAVLKLHKRADPTCESLTIDLSWCDRPIAMVSASDLHMGGGYTDHKAIRTTTEYIIEHDNLYLGLSGDSIEGFIPGVMPAETIEQQPSSVKAQLWALDSLTKELCEKNKLWWMMWGDHDAKWFEKTVGINIVRELVKGRVPYFVGRGLATVLVGDQKYYILVNHSERFRSQWNVNHPERRAYEQFFPADVVISGHTHKPAFQMFHHYDALREAGLEIGGEAWLVHNGTFKTGPDPYTIRGWTRGIMGVPTIVFHPDKHEKHVFRDPQSAVAYMRGDDERDAEAGGH